MAYGAILGQTPSGFAPLEGLPTNDVRNLTIASGYSVNAGDVVNVGRELISGTTFGELSVGSTVQINESGTQTDYIVVHQGKPSSLYDVSCDGTWLLRKDVLEDRHKWDAGNSNILASSDIHEYLNGEWIGKYDSATLDNIKQVKIPYCVGGGNNTVNSGGNGLSAKAFLLSGYEVGWTTSDISGIFEDGAKLSYFLSGTGTNANNKRIANRNNYSEAWWLRSIYKSSYAPNDVVCVGLSGNNQNFNPDASNGIRPCIIMDSSVFVDTPAYDETTVYRDVTPQANVENVITSTAVTATDTCYLNEQYSITVLATSSNVVAYMIDNATGKSVSNATVYSGSVTSVSVTRLDDTHFVVQWNPGGNEALYLKYAVVSGSTISFPQGNVGTEIATDETLVGLDETRVLSIFNNSSSLKAKIIFVTSSGNGVSTGAPIQAEQGVNPNYISACKLPDDSNGNKRVCICFADTGDGNKGKAVIATIDSGNAVTFGDVVNFNKTVTSTSICSVACDSKRIFFSIGRNGYTSNLNLGDLVDLSISTQTLLNIDENIFVNVSPTPVVGTVTCTANTIIFNDSSYDIGEQFQYAEECSNMSAAIISKNSILIAYADNKNSNYGTTTILEVNGNQIAGSFIDNSKDAIALADGTGGQEIPVGFGGYCECPGVTEGETIDSSGVSAVAVQDGWLLIKDAWNKGYVIGEYVGTGTFGASNPIGIDVGFTPSFLVINGGDAGFGIFSNPNTLNPFYNSSGNTLSSSGVANGSKCVTTTWTDTGISFYSLHNSKYQMNSNGAKYQYIAWR